MPCDVQSLAADMRRVVDDPKLILQIQVGNAVERHGQFRDFNVMISHHQRDRDTEARSEIHQRGFQLGRDAGGRMEKIARDDEMPRLRFFRQC